MTNQKSHKEILVLPCIENPEEIERRFLGKIKLFQGFFPSIEFIFSNGGIRITWRGRDLATFDYVWLTSPWNSTDPAYAVARYLSYHKTPFSQVERSASKVSDYVEFALNGLPCPDSYFCKTAKRKEKFERIERICQYPLVVKGIRGSRGRESYLVNSRRELESTVAKLNANRSYIFQQFIPNDFDWGVLVSKGKVLSGEKSSHSDTDYRNNKCHGASEVFIGVDQIPGEVAEIAVKANAVLGLDWGRSDIIVDKNTGKPYILETNRFPGTTSGSTEVSAAVSYLKGEIPWL